MLDSEGNRQERGEIRAADERKDQRTRLERGLYAGITALVALVVVFYLNADADLKKKIGETCLDILKAFGGGIVGYFLGDKKKKPEW